MQEKYLGDSHDYVKYALLRHLHRQLGVRIGVNWYLVAPSVDHPSNNDGQKRHHLKGGIWARWDSELFNRCKVFENEAQRVIQSVRTHGLLPDNTLYFEENVTAMRRAEWHERSLKTLHNADLVFLDPDNGFEVKSTSARTLAKYALYEEAIAYHRAGKIVVAIQFARQCKPEVRAQKVRHALYDRAGYAYELPVIRARVAPNILFLFLAPPEQIEPLVAALASFASLSEGKVELVW
ncbi:MAG: hypothetical protein PHW63_01230 [Alphaproteobacteria bacterium]|nr:hypothetical protein [Alphaproteobacteria bacterium]